MRVSSAPNLIHKRLESTAEHLLYSTKCAATTLKLGFFNQKKVLFYSAYMFVYAENEMCEIRYKNDHVFKSVLRREEHETAISKMFDGSSGPNSTR